MDTNQLNEKLLETVKGGDMNAAEALLEQGADDINGMLKAAAYCGFPEIVKRAMERGATHVNDALVMAADSDHADVVKLLLAGGADVNARNVFGCTALVQGAGTSTGMVKLLLAGGADVNEKDADGNTALFSAVRADAIETARTLLEHGADVNAQNNADETALFEAVRGGSIELTMLLLEHGADVKAENHDEKTAIDIAKGLSLTEMVELLRGPRKPGLLSRLFRGWRSPARSGTGTTDAEGGRG